MIGIVRALRRHERVVRVAIPSIAVKEADAAYLGEPPPPLSVVQITDTGAGRYVVDGPVGHVETLLHDDFLHVGAGPSHTTSQRHDITGTRTTTSSSFSNLGAEAAITVTFTKYHDGSDLIGGGQINAYSIGPGVAQLQVSLQINGTDYVIIDAQLNAVVGVVEWPNGTSDPITDVPAGTYTVTFRWRRALGGGTIQTDATQQASFWITETGGVMGDTPWAMESTPTVAVQPLGAVGQGVARFVAPGTFNFYKATEALLIEAGRAHWFSARIRIGDLSAFYSAGFVNDTSPNLSSALIAFNPNISTTNWYVVVSGDGAPASFEFVTGVPAEVGEWIDIDIVAVGGGFVAGWINGSGPYTIDSPVLAVGEGFRPQLRRLEPDDADAYYDIDYVRVVAFNTGPPQELSPDGTTVVPPPAVNPRLLDALEPIEADVIEVTPG